MTKISIVFHSGYGHTKVLAEQVKAGADQVPGTETRLIPVEEVDAHWADLEASDAIIFGSPTYMGSVSGPFKSFMDASSKPWFEQKWKDKVAAGFTISSSPSGDKLNTLQTLMIFGMQHGMIWVGTAELPGGEGGINRLGSMSGVMAQAGQVPPEVEPNEADRKTGQVFGRRVAQTAARWKQGA